MPGQYLTHLGKLGKDQHSITLGQDFFQKLAQPFELTAAIIEGNVPSPFASLV
jgi:hypothetical protein